MRYIEPCGGIGGFSYGIKKAYEKIKNYYVERGISLPEFLKPVCVGYYENDKYAVQTYNKNFGTSWKPTDITKLHAREIPKHDILCAGFPCQSFSIAGKRKGFEDTRGTIFFDICRIAAFHRTPLLFLENVKGLLSHDEGRTFGTILKTLSELGYSIEWQVLNSKHYGVPQNRERVFIIGHLRGEGFRQIFPLGEVSRGIIKQLNQPIHSTNRLYNPEGIARSIRAQAGGKGAKTGLYITHCLQPRSKERPSYKKAIEAGLPAPGGSGHLTKDDGTSYCLDSTQSQAIEYSNKIRRLTPTECERLQAFPDGWTQGVSESQRYKQLGNAVTVNVIEAITAKLTEAIK